MDFIKRADVMRGLETLIWDAVIFDEAHRLTEGSERGEAAALLASRAQILIGLSVLFLHSLLKSRLRG